MVEEREGLVWWSGGNPAVVEEGEGLKWWSGRATTSGGGPAEVRSLSGGTAEVRRWSRRSFFLLFFLLLFLRSPFKRNVGSIYRFLEWHGP
ncbi:hypothetical protein MA16_Dca024251 [Dendrobium catenatum]|uniref:Uncharacterized protein n=1 Tax=Dendrobium catenatum TaxID=906689 RepID=A0A2I0WZT7_9ASPA|nr:hypothetical protein MA16_Dca024251 [Dendrobium catenatum]